MDKDSILIGWQCVLCGVVYSPFVFSCKCSKKRKYTSEKHIGKFLDYTVKTRDNIIEYNQKRD